MYIETEGLIFLALKALLFSIGGDFDQNFHFPLS